MTANRRAFFRASAGLAAAAAAPGLRLHAPLAMGLAGLGALASQRAQGAGIQDGYNRKGLISNQGVRKQAFHTLRDFYRGIEARFD